MRASTDIFGLGLGPAAGGFAGGPPTPAALSGLAVWYTADDPNNTITEGNVESWYDRSGNSRHGTCVLTSNRPALSTDPAGRTCVSFNGSNNYLRCGPPASLDHFTIFVAFRLRSHTNGGRIVTVGRNDAGDSSVEGVNFQQTFNAHLINVAGKTSQANVLGTLGQRTAMGDPEISLVTVSPTSASLRRINGTESDTSTDYGLTSLDLFTVGAGNNNTSPGSYSAVDVYEVGLVEGELTAAELDALELYLRQRNGIAWSPAYLATDLEWWHDDWSTIADTGGLVDQWDDRSGNSRHWQGTTSARPTLDTDAAGHQVLRFDGSDDVMEMAGTLPALQPMTVLVVYRVLDHVDYRGILSAAAATGLDHANHWTFQQATSGLAQWYGRSGDANALIAIRPDNGDVNAALLVADAGAGGFYDLQGVEANSYSPNSLGTPAAIVLGSRRGSPDATNFSFSNVEILATVACSSVLPYATRLELLGWAGRKFGATAPAAASVSQETALNLVWDGNSIPAGFDFADRDPDAYPYVCGSMIEADGYDVQTTVVATDGLKTPDMVSRAAATVEPLLSAQRLNVLIYVEGTNYLRIDGSDTDEEAAQETYVAARLAAGWDVVIPCTIIDGDITTDDFAADRTAVNTWLDAGNPTGRGGLVDLDAKLVELSADPTTPTNHYQADGTHPSITGHLALGGQAYVQVLAALP